VGTFHFYQKFAIQSFKSEAVEKISHHHHLQRRERLYGSGGG
jgi:hypothetical protein